MKVIHILINILWISYVKVHNKNKRREAVFVFIATLKCKCSVKSNGECVSTNLRVKFQKYLNCKTNFHMKQ